ncbi:MAG: sugar phosphate isomerase/epimerase [Rectinema sp.]
MIHSKIGINLWNWVPAFSDENLQLIEHVASLGFDVIEIGMMALPFDYKRVGELARSCGVAIDLCGAFTQGRDISNFDPSVRESTKAYFRACFDAAEQMGARLFVGPVYAGGSKAHLLGPDERQMEWDLAVQGLKELCAEAFGRGIVIGLEPINRYRTSVVNTVEEALRMVADVDSPALGILYDTFQANIEESDPPRALARACKEQKLVHFHASENHRGPPGSGYIDWKPLFSELAWANYQGHITIETFAPGGMDAPWNQYVVDPDLRATQGLRFLSDLIAENRIAQN